jgi:predicted dithiol-disulfide oxidoreductase (DUF899 family)
MTDHKTGTREEWLAGRLELLEAEKELTRRSDEVARQGRSLSERRPYLHQGGLEAALRSGQGLSAKRPGDEQGISVFYQNQRGEVFHAYSCHGRGIDMVNGAYQFLDLVPKVAMRTASNSRWSGYAGTISIEYLEDEEMHWNDRRYD